MLKKKYPGKKIGHGGTLDPLAEGVLVVGIGREGTRQLHTVLKGTNKTYIATIELGKTSETDDAEGPITQMIQPYDIPSLEDIQSVLSTFEGSILQIPPQYSAVKIDGVPAYKRARRGEQFTLKPKQVTINSIRLLKYEFPVISFKVVSGSGVYIRSLARDIGVKLKTGAYVTSLVRTAVGSYDQNEAIHI